MGRRRGRDERERARAGAILVTTEAGGAVLGLLRGEELDMTPLTLTIMAARIGLRRDTVLAGGLRALKSRSADNRDEEIQRLGAKFGEITMVNELFLERSRTAGGGLRLALRRLMPAAGLVAPTWVGNAQGPAAHGGTILPERWGGDVGDGGDELCHAARGHGHAP